MLYDATRDRGLGRRFRFGRAEDRLMIEQCCSGDLTHVLLQINVICLLLALIGAAAIPKHPAWFGDASATAQSVAER